MHNPGLLGLEFESHPTKPFRKHRFGLLNDRSVGMEDDESVRVSHQVWSVASHAVARPLWEALAEQVFHPVQGDIRQQGRSHPALGCPFLCCEELTVFHQSGLEPLTNLPLEGWARSQL